MGLLKSSDFLRAGTSNIPDLLSMLVCLASGLFWGRYIILRRHGITNEQTQFCQIAGTAVPLAFFLKWPFKFVFGRVNPRFWLSSHVSVNFHWFHGGSNGYDSFPSGHMMVFGAFFAALWLFYPPYRLISIGLMLLLGTALVATDYHFVSDVIAGAYLGLFITFLTVICFEKISCKSGLVSNV